MVGKGGFFGGFGRKANNKSVPEMSQNEKEHLYNVRQAIYSALGGNQRTRTEQINRTAISDLADSGAMGGFTQRSFEDFSQHIHVNEMYKRNRLEVYREMSKYPEIAFAVDEYVDEALNEDPDGNIVTLKIKDASIEDSEIQRKTLQHEFNSLINNVINFNKHIDRWFREYMIDGEIYFEMIADIANSESGIVGVKKMSTIKTNVIWDDIDSDDILFYTYQSDENSLITMEKESIAYANSGHYDVSRDESQKIVLSFLEETKTTYRRLKLLEDALIIYRIVRAPERRVFKIDVGNLPAGRSEQCMNEMMTKYRQRKVFNSETGEVSETLDSMAMTEDFWFPVFAGGRSSDVTSLQGGAGLGEIEDVEYFKKKMYQGLKVPMSRWGEEKRFSIGNDDQVTREELKFVKQVKKYVRRFGEAIKDIFMTHLRLKGIADQYGIDSSSIEVKLLANNLFEQYMEAKILDLNFDNFSKFNDYMNTEKPLFSAEFIAKKYLRLDSSDWEENQRYLLMEEHGNELTGESDDESQEEEF